MTRLESLDLSGNSGLTGMMPVEWSALSTLSYLDVSDNTALDAEGLPTEWASLGRLEYLDASGLPSLSGTIPAEWSDLGGTLRHLDASGNAGLNGTLPTAWSVMNRLTYLDVSGNMGKLVCRLLLLLLPLLQHACFAP